MVVWSEPFAALSSFLSHLLCLENLSATVPPSPSQARAQQGWLVAGTVRSPGPETAHTPERPVTNCLEFLWDQPTLLVLGR